MMMTIEMVLMTAMGMMVLMVNVGDDVSGGDD